MLCSPPLILTSRVIYPKIHGTQRSTTILTLSKLKNDLSNHPSVAIELSLVESVFFETSEFQNTMPILEIESRLLIYKTRVIATILYRQYVDEMSLNRDGLDLEEYFSKL